MYQLLALINGIILSVMISVNGNLSVQYSACLLYTSDAADE